MLSPGGPLAFFGFWGGGGVFFKFYFTLFLEGKGGREGKKHQCVIACHATPPGDLAGNPGMCPDWESNLKHFALQAGPQSTEPHQPGLVFSAFLFPGLDLAALVELQASLLRDKGLEFVAGFYYY